jgi:aspartyl protease family protein
MTNNFMLGGVYLLMAMMLVLSALMVRREPFARLLTYALAWIAIFGAGFLIFTFRDDLGMVWQRVKAEATGEPVRVGEEIRIPMAIDGHFWVDGTVNGQKVSFLVDSGATITTIGSDVAQEADVEMNPRADQIVRTGSGFLRVTRGRAQDLRIGTIERENIAIHVTDRDGLNVLGMNFLSTLDRWGVEGRWLVMVP